jgi:iron(III) transport system permease protein
MLLLIRNRMLGAEKRFVATAVRGGSSYQPLDLRRWRRPLSFLVGAFIVFTSLLPLLGLVLMSCVKALTTLVAPWHLFTSSNWHQVATDVTFRRSITNSLIIAAAGGAITVAFVAVTTVILTGPRSCCAGRSRRFWSIRGRYPASSLASASSGRT